LYLVSGIMYQDEGHVILTKRTVFVIIKHPNNQTGAQRSMER